MPQFMVRKPNKGQLSFLTMNGTLHVYGALTESACSLEMTTARQEVWLGETGTAHFQRPGDRGTPVAFELTLKDCLQAPASNRDAWTGVLA